ncbi:hypothetical protein [Arthrobacter sp. HS15c]|uniref:hypothetical protein n=1 Tax=Arthrobacter sp. HS15c TaxID=3230279 RepID=UPI003467ECDF
MKILISGKEYDLQSGLQRPSLLTLMELQAKAGVGMKTLMATSRGFVGKSPLDIIDEPETLKVFAAIIWLARRTAGEKITFEESAEVPLDEYAWPEEKPEPAAVEAPAERPTRARTASVRAEPKTAAKKAAAAKQQEPSTT